MEKNMLQHILYFYAVENKHKNVCNKYYNL